MPPPKRKAVRHDPHHPERRKQMISYDLPIRFDLGIDCLPYAILPNEFEAEVGPAVTERIILPLTYRGIVIPRDQKERT